MRKYIVRRLIAALAVMFLVSALSWDGVWPSWAGEQTVWLVPEEARRVELTMDLGDEPVTVRLERKEGAA